MRNLSILLLLLLLALTGCKREIDFDYHDVEPVVNIEGRITNEQAYVLITRSRSMGDSVRGRGIGGADVVISGDGRSEQLVYHADDGRYHSPTGWTGEAGKTYQLRVTLDGRQYEATSTMPPPAPITSASFTWLKVLTNQLLIFSVWATDPEPDVRNYYWYRMDRRSVNPEARRKQAGDAYRWNVFDDRGSMGGRIYRDIHCMMDEQEDDPDEDDLKSVLFDGDTITFQLMTIDRPAFEYYQSLSSGQRMGANPQSNITGGCQGYFAAGNVTRTDTLYYHKTNRE